MEGSAHSDRDDAAGRIDLGLYPYEVREWDAQPASRKSRARSSSIDAQADSLMINDLWYKNAVIYCLSVGTYMDANGDGIGDFKGLMRRLDYLHGLGVTAIWLMPFQTSPGTRRRLRHLRLLRRRSALRHARRFRRVHACAQAARHPRDHRSGRQPHLRRASLVSGGAARSTDSKYRDWYVWSTEEAGRCQQGHGVSRRAEVDLDARPRSRAPGTSTASTIFSPTSTPPIRRCRPRSSRSWASGSSSACPAFAWTPCRSSSRTKGADVQQAGRAIRHAARLARVPAMARGRRHHPRRGQRAARTPTWSISATTATACT